MKSKTVIIILSSIIVIQIIAGIFILTRERQLTRNLELSPLGVMQEKSGDGKQFSGKGNRLGEIFSEPGFMKEKLSMNQVQIEKVTALNKKFDSEFSAYSNIIRPEREKLKEMLKNESNIDFDAVKKQLKKIGNINTEIQLLRIKQGGEISKILTPEQMKTLRSERKLFFNKLQKQQEK